MLHCNIISWEGKKYSQTPAQLVILQTQHIKKTSCCSEQYYNSNQICNKLFKISNLVTTEGEIFDLKNCF